MNNPSYAIFAVTKRGMVLARKVMYLLDGSRLYIPSRYRKDDAEAEPFESLREAVEDCFYRCKGLIFLMATGIVVRTIAPLLKGKDKDPAILVMDEKGRHVISLVSGHLGGANELARRIAGLIGAEPVITTATDINGLPCIEDIALRLDSVIEDKEKIKLVNSAIVNGGRVGFIDDDTERLEWLKRFLDVHVAGFEFQDTGCKRQDGNVSFEFHSTYNKGTKADVIVAITEKVLTGFSENTIFLRPKRLVVGIGCRRGVDSKEIERAYLDVLKRWRLSSLSVKNLATIDIKRDEEGLLDFARRYNLEIDFFSNDELLRLKLPSGASSQVMERIGIGGVCEPAAMRSAGVEEIWVKKERLGRVTIAIAKGPFIL